MMLTVKMPRQYIEELEQENDQIRRKLVRAEKKVAELEASLETSRRLYSVERQARERAQDAAEFLTNQNTFLQNALMRAMNTYKEAYRENKEEKQNHGAV